MKRTLVIGASSKPERYSYLATNMLAEYGHQVYAFGPRQGKILAHTIETAWPSNQEFDTITLYLNPTNQEPYYQQILDLKPIRVIFNPGTENAEFEKKLTTAGIEAVEACTLVMLRTGQF